ncbi:hypothetical protein O8C89_05375 [Aliarcobacter butzleri]|uniref:hypothetical protein n=1 Tax=Aliarcobacter butzleri TaxID=28197 RepID=UPI00263D33D6|nr:hypothetical protein [Aliarcobacter butzleri]MDN5079945.1 hypothetical protein [Aliarcobacter butzleri]
METIKYLLVTEGPTDFIILKKISSIVSKYTNKNIEFIELSPQKDETMNRYPNHGWKEVRNWCRLNGKNMDNLENEFAKIVARGRNWKGLVKITQARGIIIQIDTDIADYIDELGIKYEGKNKFSRKKFCEKAILNWLGENSLVENLFLVKSTYCMETFILATYPRNDFIFNDLPANFDYENITDVIPRLISLGFESYSTQDGIKKLSKDLNLYKGYSNLIKQKFRNVRLECEEIDSLCKKLESD